MPKKVDTTAGWTRLTETTFEKFYCGITLKFKTNDSGPVGIYQYALGLRLPLNRQLMFVSLEGQCWAHGPFPLPAESNAETGPSTVSVKWLLENFQYIATVKDMEDVWFAKAIFPVPEAE